MKGAAAALPKFGGGGAVGESSSSGDYGTYLSTELPDYFDDVVREFWPLVDGCLLYTNKSNLETKGFFRQRHFKVR